MTRVLFEVVTRSEVLSMITCQEKGREKKKKEKVNPPFFLLHRGRKDPREEMIDVLTA